MVHGNLKREYFEMEDGRVVMFCSPLPTQMELPFEGGPDEQDGKL